MSQHKRNTEIAHQAIRRKSDAMFNRVMTIINKMKVDNEHINFNHIAKVANVSKSWLYRHNGLSAVIEELRATQKNNRTVFRSTLGSDSKKAIIDVLKQRIQKLEAENKELRLQLEIMYGELHLKSNIL